MADNQLRGTEVQDCPSIRVTQSDNCPSIRVRLTGGGGTKAVDPLDVNFYDYDGTCVAAYTAADFAALDAMPGNPSHQGLTAQGWNWSLSDAKAYAAAYGKLNIGQQYITDDGKTRLYINIAEPGRMAVPLNVYQTAVNGVTVDWGDGNTAPVPASGYQTVTHTYAAPGNYTITLEVTSGTAGLGGTGNAPCIGVNNNGGRVYANMLLKAEIGEKMALQASPFNFCYSLESVSIPNSVTTFPNNCFQQCRSLLFVSLPDGTTTLGTSAFSACSSLKVVAFPESVTSMGTYALNDTPSLRSLTLPEVGTIASYFANQTISLASLVIPAGVTTIDASAFSGALCLASVTIPSTVTTIGGSAFSGCHGLAELHLLPTTPPTLGTTVFNNLPADAKIYVPAASLATYQGASGWSTYASQMIGE